MSFKKIRINKNFLTITSKISLLLFIILLSLSISLAFISISYRRNIINSQAYVMDVILHPDTEDPQVKIAGKIYYPKNASLYENLPAVILQHGFGSNKGNLGSMAINFVNRGFIAAAFDLRRHGESTGYFTFGNKESDDLVNAIHYLKTNFSREIVNVTRIGLVGHSMGAVTVIMASYKTEVNSCVAISPAAFITELLSTSSNGDISLLTKKFGTKNPFDNPEYINNITLTNYIQNRTKEQPIPKVRNLLICSGLKDVTVPTPSVYNFFKNVTQLENPENNTLYGNFLPYANATQLNIYNDSEHGDQQYTFKTPQITLDAINWTERALLTPEEINTKPPLTLDSLIMNNLNYYADYTTLFYYFSFLALFISLFLWLITSTYGLEIEEFKKLEINITKKEFYRNILSLLIIAVPFGLISRYIYFPGWMGTLIPDIAFRLLTVLTLPIIVFLIIFLIKKKELLLKNPFYISLGIANDKKSMIKNIVVGLIIGFYLPVGIVLYTKILPKEEIFKPIVFWDIFLKTWIALTILLSILDIFFFGILKRISAHFKARNQEFITIILTLVISLFLPVILLSFDPILIGYLNYSGLSLDLRTVIMGAMSFLMFLIARMGVRSSQMTKSILFGVISSSTLVTWLLLSIMPVI